MFLCTPCHKKTKCMMFHFMQSYGKCEECGKVKVCEDCHA